MTEQQTKGLARVAAIVVLTMAAVFVFRLAGLALATRQARRVEALQRAEVAAYATQVAALETATFNGRTDAYAERWARESRQWARAGDHVLAPVMASPTPEPTPAQSSGPGPLERLWQWLRSR
jgi:hypothetical protein